MLRVLTPRFAAPLLALALLGAGGCSTNDPVYFEGTRLLQVDGMMVTEDKETVPLRFRDLTTLENQERDRLIAQLGYDVPRLREDRIHIEIRYTVTNQGDREGTFALNLDGASEFTRYDQDIVAMAFDAAGQDPVRLPLIQSIRRTIGPGEVHQGNLREDDFREASLDVDAMGRFMGNFAALLLVRSEADPTGLGMTPPNLIRPALWELTPRFTADQPMTCQFLIRVRDDDRRLWEEGAPEFQPMPTDFMPVIMMM